MIKEITWFYLVITSIVINVYLVQDNWYDLIFLTYRNNMRQVLYHKQLYIQLLVVKKLWM